MDSGAARMMMARVIPVLALSVSGGIAIGELATASLQPDTVTIGGRQWKPADPTISDSNPIGTSQRVMPIDMRAGTNFERLYQLDPAPNALGVKPLDPYYMRMNGGVIAVFRRSTYVELKDGKAQYATVPPGAVYSLGGNLDHILGEVPQPEPTPENERRIDHSARPKQPDQAAPRPNAPMPVQPQRPDNGARPDLRARPDGRPDAGGTSDQPPAQPRPGDRPVPNTEVAPKPAPNSDPLPHSIWYDEPYRQARISELLDQAAGRR